MTACTACTAAENSETKKASLPIQNKINLTIGKIVNIKKDSQVVKCMNVHRKSRHFTGKNWLIS